MQGCLAALHDPPGQCPGKRRDHQATLPLAGNEMGDVVASHNCPTFRKGCMWEEDKPQVPSVSRIGEPSKNDKFPTNII